MIFKLSFFHKLLILFILSIPLLNARPPMYFAIAADTEFFERAKNLIATIHHYNFDCLEEIAVYDLGLTSQERLFINSIAKTNVYDVEMVHPDLLKKFLVHSWEHKMARGYYAWKPVILKQSLEKFPYVLYLDAGISVVGPLDEVFEHIQKVGYFFLDCNYPIKNCITRRVMHFFNLYDKKRHYITEQLGISAGVQGVSQYIYNEYVKPMYELAHHIEYFGEDGTQSEFGARHDQTIASIYVNLLGYTIHRIWHPHGPLLQCIKGSKPFNREKFIMFTKEKINSLTTYRHIRFKSTYNKAMASKSLSSFKSSNKK